MQIILTHENADFDALASLLAAHKLTPSARPVLPRRLNRNVQAFLALYRTQLPFVDQEMLPRGQHIRKLILVDTQTVSSVRGIGPIEEAIIIDHHAPPESLPPGWHFQGQRIGATTTLLVEALAARLVTINSVEATLMLTGIYEDTGSLSYAGVTPRDLRAAAWLLERGADLSIVNEFLHHPLSPGQQTLYESLLDQSETLSLGGHSVLIAWVQAPAGMSEEISTLAHKLRDLLDPSALFVLVGMDSNTQLVARSSTDDINVAEVAAHFGGRGHERAAAAQIRERPVQEVHDELKALLPAIVRPRLSVRSLMSQRVRTVAPEELIGAAADQMLRTGHEGYPVVEESGRVIGLLTRNAVDRAMQHGWRLRAVRQIMEPGEVTVSPQDSVERVRMLMIQTGWGQIPVVADGKVIGVVTRTDLIRLPPPERETRRQQIAQQMELIFPASLLALIHRIGEAAATRGYSIYFVGGIVRDLLLGHSIVDIDIVVEGDAIRLAQAVAQAYGGEVRTHRRFGTAKWLLPEEIWREVAPDTAAPTPGQVNLPAFIDLVTARTEFYSEPTALPLVEWSAIKQDLHRRDFTINTLAIRLDPNHWGELLDFYGGEADLRQKIIRVLHSLSFIDDPTRILRAARFEARLNFRLDPRSEALIADALPMLNRITGSRIRHELDLIFHEARPEAALERLQAFHALQAIHPALHSDDWLQTRYQRLRTQLEPGLWELSPENQAFLPWAILFYRLDAEALTDLALQLMLPRHIQEYFDQLPALQAALESLPLLHTPSRIVAQLEPFNAPLLAAAWVITDDATICERLEYYWRKLRHIQAELGGDDLRALGIAPGPLYRRILAELRQGRLDGTITSREAELALVQEILRDAPPPEPRRKGHI